MAYPTPRPLADKYLCGQIVDVSTASVAYITVPAQSVLVDGYCALSAGITSADAVITVKKGSTTLGTITLANSGSAAGSSFQLALTGSEADRTFAAGDVLVLDGDGASSTTSIGRCTMVMREL